MTTYNRALIVIDIQNDYFPGGAFPLWNTEETLTNIEHAIATAKEYGVAIVLVQHIADSSKCPSPFFNQGTPGAEIHPRIKAATPEAAVVVKHFADGFYQTTLDETLQNLGAGELLVCGMMTQNCVTHTAISKSAEKYKVVFLKDCCTTVSEMIHKFALNAVSTRLAVMTAAEALG